MNVTIRDMTIHDFDVVRNIAYAGWYYTYSSMVPVKLQQAFLAKHYEKKHILRRMQKSTTLIAEVDGEAVGFATFTMGGSVKKQGKLEAIYLYPTHWRKGLGSRLIDEGMKRLGCIDSLLVTIMTENEAGRQFYKAKGFTQVKISEKSVYPYSVTMITMKLTVSRWMFYKHQNETFQGKLVNNIEANSNYS
ncbi:GNAT family N-acetyltransferase [Metabacillus iocasae]|uniref:Ribosomal protein S18 acetylase RimI-like enzyme n=1 Tax=Priestia iocasae TaxID=2291674 RepID=A0ABS2QUH2_9BACI|nr:ribosomal protein S18 acetylase RimI-like enzyme [Metabacillus iocasae]